jgi:hypothetical protein
MQRRQLGRARTGGAVLGGLSLAAAAAVATVGNGAPAGAQAAPAPYSCAADSVVFPPGTVFATQVTGSATAPASVDIGQTASLTDVAVGVQFDPAEIANILEVAGGATLGPNGSAGLGTTGIGEDGLASYAGGTGSVTGAGASGSTMDVTLDQLVLVVPTPGGPPILTATCTPTGAPVTLASLELTGEAPTTTAPPTTGPPTTGTPTTRPNGPTTPPTTLPQAPPAVGSAGTGDPRFTG